MPRPTAALLVTLVAATLGRDAAAHGGQYNPPRLPLGPVTGVDPGDAGKFSAPGMGGPPIPTLPPSSVLRRPSTTEDGSGWRLWWRANGPTIRAATPRGQAAGMAELTGRARDAAATWAPLSDLLRRGLDDPQIDVVDSAILARGRSASSSTADETFQAIWPFVGHPVESIRRSAIASLGLVESERAVPVLVSLLSQSRYTDPVTSGIAAVALGYHSSPEGVKTLQRVVDRGQSDDMVCAAIVALGLYRESQREIVIDLLARLDDASLSDLARAQIPVALARLGEEAAPAVPALQELLTRARAPSLRRAAVIALGRLVSPEDDDAVRRLVNISDRSREGTTRGLALVALGEVARRAGSAGTPAAARAREQLLQRLASPMHRSDLGYACLAAARAVGPLATGHEDRDTTIERLERLLRDRRSDAFATATRGAAAVALGLLEHAEVVAELRALGERTEDVPLKRDIATALGMLGDRGSIPLLRRWVERGRDAGLRQAAIEALGALSREVATKVLLRRLEESDLPSERVLVTQGLARVAGPSALPTLVRLAEDEESDALTRAFAVVALGRLLEPRRPTWNERLAAHADPLSQCRPVLELLDLF